jgi:hypothetical protein
LGKSSAIETPHILQIGCRAEARRAKGLPHRSAEREGGRAKHTPEAGGTIRSDEYVT